LQIFDPKKKIDCLWPVWKMVADATGLSSDESLPDYRGMTMKYCRFPRSSVHSLHAVTVLVGVQQGKSLLVAKKGADGAWPLYQNDQPASMKKEHFRRVATLGSMNEVLAHFDSLKLIPYCPKDQLKQPAGQSSSRPGASAKAGGQRQYFRKKVNLNGEYRNARTGRCGDLLVEDVSFNGMKFSTIGGNDIELGDRVFVSFILNNAKKSLIKREVHARHVKDNKVGAEFINSPEYDKELGFHLWVCHG
jgi:hypothetical protein